MIVPAMTSKELLMTTCFKKYSQKFEIIWKDKDVPVLTSLIISTKSRVLVLS